MLLMYFSRALDGVPRADLNYLYRVFSFLSGIVRHGLCKRYLIKVSFCGFEKEVCFWRVLNSLAKTQKCFKPIQEI